MFDITHMRLLNSHSLELHPTAVPPSDPFPSPLRQDVVRKVESGTTDGRDRPVKEVAIADCGHEALAEADYFPVTKDDATA